MAGAPSPVRYGRLATSISTMSMDLHSAGSGTVALVADDESPLAARIQRAISIAGVSASELSRRAGLHRAHVGATLGRLRDNPASTVSTDILRKIAQAAGVSERWLVLGTGGPDDDDSAGIPEASEAATATHRDLQGWEDAVALARFERPDLTDHALEMAARGASQMVHSVTAEMVIALADFATKHAQDADLRAILAERRAKR